MSKRLLLADDSITIQKVVQITFAHEDYELIVTDNGDKALAMARELKPQLVLADVYMPGKNGYELCAAIKQDAGLHKVPVLLLAGSFEPFDEGKARAAGADGWIEKPFESQALVDKVAALLSAASAPAAAAPAPAPAQPATAVPPPTPQAPVGGDPFADISFDEPAAVEPANDWSDLNLTPEPAASAAGSDFAFETPPDEPPAFAFESTSFARPDETPAVSPEPPPIDFDAFGEPEEVMALGDDDILGAEDLEPISEMSTLTPWSRADFSVEDTFGDVALGEISPPVFEPAATEPVIAAPDVPPVEPAPMFSAEPVAAAPAAPPAPSPLAATSEVVEQRVATLSETEIEQIVERAVGKVIEKLAGSVLEKVAWEVVPDLAEVMIKEEIRKIKEAAA